MGTARVLSREDIELTEFGIGLMPDQTVVHLVTPQFLSLNGIVPQSWSVVYPVIANRQMAEVQYENGLVVRADANEVGFVRGVVDNGIDTGLLCARVAGGFVGQMPGLEYGRVRFDLYGHVMLPDEKPGIFGIGPELLGSVPVVDCALRYNVADNLVVDFFAREVGKLSQDYIDCVEFRLLAAHFAGPGDVETGSNWAIGVLDGWSQPLDYFFSLVDSFWEQHVVF